MISNFEQKFRRDIASAKRRLIGEHTSLGRNKFERNVEIARFIHAHFAPSSDAHVREHNNLIRAALHYEIKNIKQIPDPQVKSILQKSIAASVARGNWEHLSQLKQAGQVDANALVLQLGAIYAAFQAIKSRQITGLTSEQRLALAQAALETHSVVADRLGLHKIKEELQEEAFRLGYPHEQRDVEDAIIAENGSHSKNANALRELLWETARALNPLDAPDEGIGHHEVHHRVKQPYSTWKKINDFNRYPEFNASQSIEYRVKELHDLFAYRVILHNPDPNACHTFKEKLIHLAKFKGWKYLSQKDYITAPKANGYSSLHLNFEKDGKKFEVQVRTKEMHDHAESGEVNHSLYQARGKPKEKTDSQDKPIADGAHLLDLFEEIGAKGAQTANIKHSFLIQGTGNHIITQHNLTYRHSVADAIGYALIDRRAPGQLPKDALKLLKEGKFGAVIKRGNSQIPVQDLRMLIERGDHIEFTPEHLQVHTPAEVNRALKSKELRRHLELDQTRRSKARERK